MSHRFQSWLVTMAIISVVFVALAIAYTRQPAEISVKWVSVQDLPRQIAVHETVFWEPLDTKSLRKLIRDNPSMVQGKSILEIGTGSGLLALCCANAGAKRVVATDINPHAIACAEANAKRLGLQSIEFRLVHAGPDRDTGAFAVVKPAEKFDLIISNPPWEDSEPKEWSEYALYDPGFRLLESIIAGFDSHLQPEGKLLLAYGCVTAIECAQRLATERQYQIYLLDDRNPQDLPAVFLPGLLMGIRPDLDRP